MRIIQIGFRSVSSLSYHQDINRGEKGQYNSELKAVLTLIQNKRELLQLSTFHRTT